MEDWQSKRLFQDKKLIVCLFNVVLYAENLYSGIFGFDKENNAIFVVSCPPWEKPASWDEPRRLEETDIIRFAADIEQFGLFNIGLQMASQAIKAVAKAIPYKSTKKPRTQRFAEAYAAPEGWFDIINEATRGQIYAYPSDLIKKVLPDKSLHGATSLRCITGILRQLGFQSIVECIKGRSRRRWKKVEDTGPKSALSHNPQ